jgi:hypothetical protein
LHQAVALVLGQVRPVQVEPVQAMEQLGILPAGIQPPHSGLVVEVAATLMVLMWAAMVTKAWLLFDTLALNEEVVERSQRLAAIPTMYLQPMEHTQHEDIR